MRKFLSLGYICIRAEDGLPEVMPLKQGEVLDCALSFLEEMGVLYFSKLKSRIEDESYHLQGQDVLPCRKTALSLSFSSGFRLLVYMPCLFVCKRKQILFTYDSSRFRPSEALTPFKIAIARMK